MNTTKRSAPRIEDTLVYKERLALEAARAVLRNAEYDFETGVVTFPKTINAHFGTDYLRPASASTLDDLTRELTRVGDQYMVDWETMEDVRLSGSSRRAVLVALEEARAKEFYDSRTPPSHFEELFRARLQHPYEHEIRLSLEEVNELLIKALAKHPSLMHELHPRRFEELVAELFHRMGYEVVLTPPSRDGGRDIHAFMRRDVGTILTFVECKRFSPEHPVGVGIVRSLYGALESEKATCAVLTTTSSFTRGAREFQQRLSYRLSLRDFNDLAEWCRRYTS